MSDDMGVIKPCDLCGMPYDGDEADRINAPLTQLRASLATITAERDAFDLERREKGDALLFHIKAYDLERAAHNETRKGLEEQTKHRANLDRKNGQLNQDLWERIEYVATQQKDLESTRKALEVAEQALIAECENACSLGAALARSEARVKELEERNEQLSSHLAHIDGRFGDV